MERCDGDLYSKLKLRPTRKFQEDEAFIYFAQLVNGQQNLFFYFSFIYLFFDYSFDFDYSSIFL